MRTNRSIALIALLFVAQGVVVAEDKKPQELAQQAMEQRLHKTLRTVINAGADLFNKGDQAGCFRLYEGALLTTVPLLEHRPVLQAAVQRGLKNLESLKTAEEKSFAARELLDQIRDTIKKDGAPVAPDALWEQLGGEQGVKTLVQEWIKAAAADPKLKLLSRGKTPMEAEKLERLVLAWLSSKTGGPLKESAPDRQAAVAMLALKPAESEMLVKHLSTILGEKDLAPRTVLDLMAAVTDNQKDWVKPAEPPKDPLWDRLGGEKAIRPIVREFLTAAVNDPKVDFSRGGKFKLDDKAMEYLELGMLQWLSQATGGPLRYEGKDLVSAHEGMRISNEQFDALASHLRLVLIKHKVADKLAEELMELLEGTRKEIVEKKD